MDVTAEAKARGWTQEAGRYKRSGVSLSCKPFKGRKGWLYNVSTMMEHPTNGKTILIRRGITSSELKQIFENPRVHTFKGFQLNSPRRRLEKIFNLLEKK